MRSNITKTLLMTIAFLVTLVAATMVLFKDILFKEKEVETPVADVETEDEVVVDYTWAHEQFDTNYAINDEYIGHITFESGLIDLPVVQARGEDKAAAYDKYLRTDWATMAYDDEGSIFMDPQNKLDDQNLVIYGHYVYTFLDPTRTHKFTPLHVLKEDIHYEQNKYINLVLENEIRRYEVAHVYYAFIDLSNPGQPVETGMEYMFTSFPEVDLRYYLARVGQEEFYDTGIEITKDDRFLTLQTCVENHDELRLIVIAKEIEVISTR